MLVVRLFGVLIIVVSCGLVGFLKSNMLAERSKKLTAIYDGANNLYQHVEMGGCELLEAIENSFLNVKFLQVKNGVLICDYSGLTRDDCKLIDSFFAVLGSSVKKEECDKIINFKLRLNTHIKDAQSDYAQKGKLYQSFGICIGLTLAVLLI